MPKKLLGRIDRGNYSLGDKEHISDLKGCLKVSTLDSRHNSNAFISFSGFASKNSDIRGAAPKCDNSLKKVTFGYLILREHSRTLLDDNPAVTSGAAIAIGGSYTDYGPVSVEGFESRRGPRRNWRELKLSDRERLDRLFDSGYRPEEIRKAILKIKKAQLQRARSMQSLKKSTGEEIMDAISSKFHKFVMPRKGDKENTKYQKCSKAARMA